MNKHTDNNSNFDKTLEIISGISWGEISENDNEITSQRKRIRKTPINLLTADDLNILIGIGQDNEFVINRAFLSNIINPVPMSLLIRIMRIDDYNWTANQECLNSLRSSIDYWRNDYIENNEDIDCCRQCGYLFFEYAYFERRLCKHVMV